MWVLKFHLILLYQTLLDFLSSAVFPEIALNVTLLLLRGRLVPSAGYLCGHFLYLTMEF